MGTLIIKNVDLNKLEKQRLSIRKMISCMPALEKSNSLTGVINMLDEWSDERYNAKLGSLENQKAKDRQTSIDWTPKVYICPHCDVEQPHELCMYCDRPTDPIEDVK